jgi:hypothetical protein
MSFSVRLHTICEVGAEADLVGSIDCEATDSYHTFRKLLEDICIVDWPFLFWDFVNSCAVNPKLERVNKIRPNVYVLSSDHASNSAKRRRQEDGGFSTDSHEDLFPLLPANEAYPLYSNDAGVGAHGVHNTTNKGLVGYTVGYVELGART